MRWVLALLAWLISATLFAPLCFLAVVWLAGPHGGVLPSSLRPLVLVLGWAFVLVVPALIARAVWRHASRRDHRVPPDERP